MQNFSSYARVIVMGYENGYDDITMVKKPAIMPEEKADWVQAGAGKMKRVSLTLIGYNFGEELFPSLAKGLGEIFWQLVQV